MRRISMDIYTLPFIGVVFVYFDRLVFVRIWIREAIADHTNNRWYKSFDESSEVIS